jgi:hypothetical protein
MASPRERDHRALPRPRRDDPHSVRPPVVHRPHFHDDVPAWPQHRYHDYVYVDRWGWWPRWFPYWDQRWCAYWWHLYDYYGGDARPEYAAYARDAVLRQNAPRWGLVVGAWAGADPREGAFARDHRHRGHSPVHVSPSPVHPQRPEYHDPRPRHEHPHYHYGDYVVVDRHWWPRWFPYWDPAWARYWWQLYDYYGGAAYPDHALHAVDATLRGLARRLGWL